MGLESGPRRRISSSLAPGRRSGRSVGCRSRRRARSIVSPSSLRSQLKFERQRVPMTTATDDATRRRPGNAPPRRRTNRERVLADPSAVEEVAGEDAQSVAALFGLRSVGVENPHGLDSTVALRVGRPDQHPIRSDAEPAVAQGAGHRRTIPGCPGFALDHQVVVAERLILGKSQHRSSSAGDGIHPLDVPDQPTRPTRSANSKRTGRGPFHTAPSSSPNPGTGSKPRSRMNPCTADQV